MKNTRLMPVLFTLSILTGCATDASRAYDQARLEANPHYQDESNQSGTPIQYTPKDRDNVGYFACLMKFNQRFSSADSRWICSP